MDLSVLIPTFSRPDEIGRCLAHLAAQETQIEFEIIIGLDGNQRLTPDPIIPVAISDRTRTIRPGRVGLLRLRQALFEQAQGRIVLWLNDDAYAQPSLLQTHADTHAESSSSLIVAGQASWNTVKNPMLFDRILHETDLIFFQQTNTEFPTSITPRNCFGLNMSFPLELARAVGGVADVDEHYGYEDIELAWRMVQRGAVCMYQPDAHVVHDHRYMPIDVHRREYLLGRAAWSFANVNPPFMLDLLGIDLREPTTRAELGISLQHAWRDALRIERSFLALSDLPYDAASLPALPILAEHWVLLKRLLWRWGVLDAARSIKPRWSRLEETSPEDVLNVASNPV